MDLKVLLALGLYYTIISLVFVFGGSYLTDFTTNVDLNSSEMQSDEIDTGGVFSTGVNFGRFLAFVGFGIGLPDDTPDWFNILYIAWSSLLTLFTIGFIISSIWDG